MLEQNVINMQDGNVVNFGSRAKLVSDQTILENGFELVFNVINGVVITYKYVSETPMPALLAEMAAFGAANKAKNATAGAKTPEDIVAIVNAKIAEFDSGVFVTRGAANLSLSLHQEAYANMEGLDKTKIEDVLKVKEFFEGLDKDARAALNKSAGFRKAIAELRLAQAIAEVEAEEAKAES